MARPRKTKTIDGIKLADNLYPACRPAPNKFRYLREDGTFKAFEASSVAAANQLAEDANKLRGTVTASKRKMPARNQLGYHVPTYITYQERLNPQLLAKKSWQNRRYAINQFAQHFAALPIGNITWDHISQWWDGIGYNQQKLRHAEFRKLFNWLMAQGLLPKLDYNPFTTADDRPRLISKQQVQKQRRPLSLPEYWAIYKLAGEMGYPALQLAMAISLYTTYRREDICKLRWDENIIDNHLQLVIGKSEAQKGSARAARHSRALDQHPMLANIINQARELSLVNRRCPFVISHWPKRRVWNQEKTHLAQITPERLTRMYAEVAKKAEITGTSFHEIRGLSSTLHRLSGYTTEQIQELMAHEDKSTTLAYQDGHELPYNNIQATLSDSIIGGKF